MRKIFYAFAAASMLMASAAPAMAEETTAEAQTIVEGDEDSVEGIETLLQQLDKRIAELKIKLKELRGETTVQEGDVIYQDDMIILTYDGITDEYGRYDIKFAAENLTDKKIRVQTADASVNGIMTYSMLAEGMEANKKAKGIFTVTDEVEVENLEDLETMEFKIQVLDDTTYQELLLTDPITINFDLSE